MPFITSHHLVQANAYRRALFLCLLFFALTCLSACATSTNPTKEASPSIHHVVLVWFKAGTDNAFINKVKQDSLELAKIPNIRQLHVGEAIPSERNIVDDSFSLGLHMLFANETEMKAYLTHPDHVAFVKRIKPQIEKLLVYDF